MNMPMMVFISRSGNFSSEWLFSHKTYIILFFVLTAVTSLNLHLYVNISSVTKVKDKLNGNLHWLSWILPTCDRRARKVYYVTIVKAARAFCELCIIANSLFTQAREINAITSPLPFLLLTWSCPSLWGIPIILIVQRLKKRPDTVHERERGSEP